MPSHKQHKKKTKEKQKPNETLITLIKGIKSIRYNLQYEHTSLLQKHKLDLVDAINDCKEQEEIWSITKNN